MKRSASIWFLPTKTLGWANNIQVKIEQNIIERVKGIKHLGLIIDEKLISKPHLLYYLQSKMRKQNYIFYHLKNYINSWHLQKLYYPLYESVFSYRILHWGASAHVEPIKVLQNKVTRGNFEWTKKSTDRFEPHIGFLLLSCI
jgi:hypothetical protein